MLEALKDKVDIEWFFEGWDNVKCKLNDFPINYMELRQLDERLDYYTPVIIANNDTLENRPELVKSFLAATEKGYKYAIETRTKVPRSFTNMPRTILWIC